LIWFVWPLARVSMYTESTYRSCSASKHIWLIVCVCVNATKGRCCPHHVRTRIMCTYVRVLLPASPASCVHIKIGYCCPHAGTAARMRVLLPASPASCVHIKISNKRCTLCNHFGGHAFRRSQYERIYCSTRARVVFRATQHWFISDLAVPQISHAHSMEKLDLYISRHMLAAATANCR